MCIRDRVCPFEGPTNPYRTIAVAEKLWELGADELAIADTCLLYTSDAADERSSVDLGGRRILKKKKM